MDQVVDVAMMRRCIHLSKTAPRRDLPIACVICDEHGVVAETTNQVRQNGDATQHAEIVAIRQAQKALKRKSLARCTLYTTVEPCAMCSFMIRETQVSRVVFAISSPVMGGISKWNILRDTEISNVIPEVFGAVPEVVANLLWREATQVWRKWNPVAWQIIKYRKCFGSAPATEVGDTLPAIAPSVSWLRRLLLRNGL